MSAVIAPDEPLCQTNSKGLEVLPQAVVHSWFEMFPQDECVHRAAVEQEPENVPEKNNPM